MIQRQPTCSAEDSHATIMCYTNPRPSHHPVFDRLPCAKMEGKGLVYYLMWMTSVSTRERGWRGALIEERISRISSFLTWSGIVLLCKRSKLQHSGQKFQGLKLVHSIGEPSPLFPRSRHWYPSHDKMYPPFLHTASDQTGRSKSLGIRLGTHKHYVDHEWSHDQYHTHQCQSQVPVLLCSLK